MIGGERIGLGHRGGESFLHFRAGTLGSTSCSSPYAFEEIRKTQPRNLSAILAVSAGVPVGGGVPIRRGDRLHDDLSR